MARYKKCFQLNISPTDFMNFAEAYFRGNGYNYAVHNGENVFQRSHGWFTGPKFVKFSFAENRVQIEGWIKMAILPYVFLGEMDFSIGSYFGIIPKKQMRDVVFGFERQLITNKYVGGVIQNAAPIGAGAQPVQPQSRVHFSPGSQIPNTAARTCPVCSRPTGNDKFCGGCGTRLY